MLMLTIDTCTDTSTLGLVRDGGVLAEAAFPSRHTLARRLLARLDWLLGECGLTKRDIGAVAVTSGPGSFTGVRIGMTVAKTLAAGLRIPLVGIPTLDVLAYPFHALRDRVLAPVINARRQQVYTALFHGDGAAWRRTPDQLCDADAFAALLRQAGADAPVVLIGQLDGLSPAFLSPDTPTVRSLVTPHALAALAQQRLQRGDADDPLTLTPIYLRAAAD